jgi:hypothetical protein
MEKKELRKVENKIFKFEKKGDEIEGQLLSIETGSNYGNAVYKIESNDGGVFIVFGTSVLQSQMAEAKIGKQVRIIYQGEKKNEKKGQNPIKLFDVYVE